MERPVPLLGDLSFRRTVHQGLFMKKAATPPDDVFQIRCPKLGHQIHFSYCRTENAGLPCSRTLQCWYGYFHVEEYLRRELTPEQWSEAFEKPVKPKILSLVELIEQAQKRGGTGEG
ncbi:MAG: hypothetical protein RBR09_11405 [Desulfobulbaceae bacterium]|jgi:hypothetical protein|nr:hypothetical protein [Desulfobulbaceae bacterium]MDY0351851.1 hypothetical protein [Desulfobulbaceae bacterium]